MSGALIDLQALHAERDALFARARKVTPNQGLHGACVAIAAAHPRAIQYLEAAPVLALAVPRANRTRQKALDAYLGYHLAPLCARGAPLKEVLRAFHLAPPLRRLTGYGLAPGYSDTVLALSRLPPAVLGRIVPVKPGLQKRWLSVCFHWRDWMRLRRRPADTRFAWAAAAMSLDLTRCAAIGHVADFASQPGEPFNEAWGWPRAAEEAHLWHARLTVDQALSGTPFTRDTQIDLGPHADVADHDGFTFLALRTPLALCDEGAAMRHCVATYIADVASGRSHIVSIQRAGKRVATLELDRDWVVRQCRGKANAAPDGEVLTAAGHYAFAVRGAARIPPARRGAA